MTPTIEEVKRVAEKYGLGDSIPALYIEELQSFAQHFMDKQRESDAVLCEKIKSNWNYCAEAIRNNTGE